ncbi:MAG: repressor LexA [Planctomycetaceae bacterium]|jgi:repressor LexA|nr:repressor LexA [Planctomycetaceae bacterium]
MTAETGEHQREESVSCGTPGHHGSGDGSLRPLSERQKQILEFIKTQLRERGYAPSIREIVRHVGDRSPTSVHRHLKTLERHGHIDRDAGKSRSIRLAGDTRVMRSEGLPLAGVIAAGHPIEAIEQNERIDFDALFNRDGHFVLEVKGDSMIEDHIAEGDMVVVKKASRCRQGDLVVVLLEGQNATLKRFYREKNRIRLQPANQALQPIYTRDVEILGIVVGVVRRMR